MNIDYINGFLDGGIIAFALMGLYIAFRLGYLYRKINKIIKKK